VTEGGLALGDAAAGGGSGAVSTGPGRGTPGL